MNMLHKWFGTKSDSDEPTVQYHVGAKDRIYAVGDVHGRVDLLNRILEMIARDVASHQDYRAAKIIFLGDYIDRGDNSKEVLDVLMGVRNELPEDNLLFLAGNHEAAVLSFLSDPVGKSEWLRYGGLQTLLSYGVAPPSSNPEPQDLVTVADSLRAAMGHHVSFLAGLQGMHRSGDVIFIHAGLDPTRDLGDQDDDATLWGRSEFVDEGGFPGVRVVHGHYDSREVVSTPRRICVDTGAYYSGRLTAVRLDDSETLIVADALDI